MYTGLIYVHQCLLTCWGLFCPASRKSGRNHRDRRRKSKGNTHYKTACCLYFSVFCHGGFVHFSCHSCHFVEKVKACNVWHRDKTTRVWHRDKRTQKRRWPSIMVVQIPSRRPTSNLFRILSHTWSICCLTHGAYVVSHILRMLSHTWSICCLTHIAYVVSHMVRMLSHTWSICCLTHIAYVVSHMVRMLSHTWSVCCLTHIA